MLYPFGRGNKTWISKGRVINYGDEIRIYVEIIKETQAIFRALG